MPRPTAAPPAEKGGSRPSHRALTQRPDDQGPRRRRWSGRPIAFEITPGQLGDLRAATALLGPLPAAQVCLAECAYDSRGFRQFLAARGTRAVVPNNPTRKNPYPFDRAAYRRRNLIERMFSRLKDFRRIATRYDKLAVTFDAGVCIAAMVIWGL